MPPPGPPAPPRQTPQNTPARHGPHPPAAAKDPVSITPRQSHEVAHDFSNDISPRRAESAVLATLMTIGLDLYDRKYVLPHSAARHMIGAVGWSQWSS
jgi:hypothetical protein